jgi:hypothetical protein
MSSTDDSIDDVDIDALDQELASVLGGEDGNEEDASDDEDNEDVIGDAVAKSMALIRQVCPSYFAPPRALNLTLIDSQICCSK